MIRFKLINGTYDAENCTECCADCSDTCGSDCPADIEDSCDKCIFKNGFKKKKMEDCNS